MYNKDLIKIKISRFFTEKITEEESQTIEFDAFNNTCKDLKNKAFNAVIQQNIAHFFLHELTDVPEESNFIKIINVPLAYQNV